MCRITGFRDFNYKGQYDIEKTITEMRDTLAYGGPDDAGNFIDIHKGLALGHRRLSIIDLSSSGHQPMSNEEKSLWITFNGEIYNFREIKDQLLRKGYKFKSNSDTEIILKAYQEWGLNCVHAFRGMWAFAIWDDDKEELILCRDRVGVKPLYWYYFDGLFMFASELKAFHKHPRFRKILEDGVLSKYLQYGYIPTPYSIFQYTFKLEPGYFLIINKKGENKKIKYWDVMDYFLKGITKRDEWINKSEEDITGELERILIESFKYRLVSDVPIGVFLSGGIDSSLVTALLQKECSKPLKTFTIGFYEKENNEAEWAKKIARYLGTDHTEFYCTPKEAFEIIPKLSDLYDEPFGDSSAIPTYLVSKLSRQQVTVSLSADGGDEQFCGYTIYNPVVKFHSYINKIPFSIKGMIKTLGMRGYSLVRFIYETTPSNYKVPYFRDKYFKLMNSLSSEDVINVFNISRSYWLENEVNILLNAQISKLLYKKEDIMPNYNDILNCLMIMDIKTYMTDDILTKIDRATMGVALESREPLLDNKVLEFSAQLPSEFKYRNGKTKYILRRILNKYIPPQFIDRPKQGFEIPMYRWFKEDLKILYEEYLSEKRLKETGLFNVKWLRKELEKYYKGEIINPSKFWLVFIFEQWKEKWG